MDKEKKAQRYKDRQQQRYNERKIRQWRKREAACITDKDCAKARAKIEEWNSRQKKFINKTGRYRKEGREQLRGIDITKETRESAAEVREYAARNMGKDIDTLKKSDLYQKYAKGGKIGSSSTKNDEILEKIADDQGFNNKPDILSANDFEDKIDKGAKRTWRGVSDPKYTDEYKDGAYYGGTGVYGNGTYTAYGERGYKEAAGYAHGQGEVMELALKKDARTIKLDKIREIKDDLTSKLRKEAEEIAEDNFVKARNILDFRSEIDDEGRLAAILGYDAINMPEAERIAEQNYMIILNRSATYVKE